jgi:hypothetical protein
MATYDIIAQATLSQAVTTICKLTGQTVPPDPAGSTDASVQQMVAALNQSASDLYALRDWQELREQLNLSIVADSQGQAEKAYDLPPQYGRFIDVTQWSQSQQWPAVGPISAQGWMQYLVNNFTPVTSLYWQVKNDQIWFLAPPFPVAQPFTAYYISRGYVRDQDNSTLFKNYAQKNGDTFLLDGQLITLLGRVKWLAYKGFDTASAMQDFQTQYDSRAGSDEGAQVYNLSGRSGMPLIGICNAPDTGYGS